MLKTIKDFVIDMFKNSWFKILVFILLCCILFIIMDFANIHLKEVHNLEAKVKAGEISYEQADFIRSATHEQIVYQLAMAIIASMIFVAGMLMEQNSKLRERVRRVDFRLWKLDRNVEEIYELQRLAYETKYGSYEELEYDDVEQDDDDKKAALKQELERLQEEHRKLIKDVQELERRHKARLEEENNQ